jgi:hypothetical protein
MTTALYEEEPSFAHTGDTDDMRVMIDIKKSAQPYRFSGTPMDTDRALFPYADQWRGDYESPYPMRYERYAGYCPRVDVAQLLLYERPFRLRAHERGRGLILDAYRGGDGVGDRPSGLSGRVERAFGNRGRLRSDIVDPSICFETAPYTRYPCYDKPYGQRGCDCATRYGAR